MSSHCVTSGSLSCFCSLLTKEHPSGRALGVYAGSGGLHSPPLPAARSPLSDFRKFPLPFSATCSSPLVAVTSHLSGPAFCTVFYPCLTHIHSYTQHIDKPTRSRTHAHTHVHLAHAHTTHTPFSGGPFVVCLSGSCCLARCRRRHSAKLTEAVWGQHSPLCTHVCLVLCVAGLRRLLSLMAPCQHLQACPSRDLGRRQSLGLSSPCGLVGLMGPLLPRRRGGRPRPVQTGDQGVGGA